MGKDVQAVVKGCQSTKVFHGSLYVVSHLLNTTYLWDTVRLQGGAYGAECMLGRDGLILFASYCDPGIKATLEAYDAIADYLQHLELTEEMLESYIVGTIGTMDYPFNMEQKSEQVIYYYLSELTPEMRLRERQEVLDTTLETDRKSVV